MAEPDNHQYPIAGNLECGICFETHHDLKVTKCAHELCQQCLQTIIETSAERNTFLCPFCRYTSHVPPGGASGFPNKGEDRKCHRCKIRAGNNECFHCHNRFCGQCQGLHMQIVRKDLEDVLRELKSALERVDNAHTDWADFVHFTTQFLRQGQINDNQAVELYHTAGERLTRIVNLVQRNETLRRTATQSIPIITQPSQSQPERDQSRSCLRKTRNIASVMRCVIDSFIQHWIFVPIVIFLLMFSLLEMFLGIAVTFGTRWTSVPVYLEVKGITGGIFWVWMTCRRQKDPTRSPFTIVQCVFSFIWLVLGTVGTFYGKGDEELNFMQIVNIVDWSLLALLLCCVCIGTAITMYRRHV